MLNNTIVLSENTEKETEGLATVKRSTAYGLNHEFLKIMSTTLAKFLKWFMTGYFLDDQKIVKIKPIQKTNK